jgi:hypothetical protein
MRKIVDGAIRCRTWGRDRDHRESSPAGFVGNFKDLGASNVSEVNCIYGDGQR